ncbi:MarR family transcriptional regulator [Bacillus toyonensis]|uniref:replication/maintenance protein RepL n=1 Tax=Bacillus toyonensis TaxID=155322 RepID=UPI000BF2049D|nr:replication/maintenance protein RepL [Bacillus toyonensis]PEK47418.1 MarR family transcriptional regulator [Bacillus toyonensis]
MRDLIIERFERIKRNKENTNTVYWGAFILDWFEYLRKSDMTGSDYKVLFLLCQKMNTTDNTTYIRQKEIAEILSMDKGNISKSIKKLLQNQFIAKSTTGFMINPHLFYIGARNRYDLRDNFDELLLKNGLTPRFVLDETERKLEEIDEEEYQWKKNHF